jgi:hypothetical protein
LDIIRNVAENSPVSVWMVWLRWQRLDLDALNNGFPDLGFSLIKDGTVYGMIRIKIVRELVGNQT